jgi:hypothetical protein
VPTIYYVKDGPGPNNSGLGKDIDLLEVEKIIRNHAINLKYLGENPPRFNPAELSQVFLHVVIELKPGESIGNLLNKPGFYILLNISPHEFGRKLER